MDTCVENHIFNSVPFLWPFLYLYGFLCVLSALTLLWLVFIRAYRHLSVSPESCSCSRLRDPGQSIFRGLK